MAFAFLRRWLFRRPVQRPDLHVVLFTRTACPLCDEAHEILLRHQKQYGFLMETKDVDESADSRRDFGDCVPVVTINSTVRFRGDINEVLLRRMLEN